jgi:hypothetical protein
MRRTSSTPKTAGVLRKTLSQLEADPTVDAQDPDLSISKCNLLQRILDLESEKVSLTASLDDLTMSAVRDTKSVAS